MEDKFYGKYRGTVSDNKDPLMMGRIRAKVPDVMGDRDSGWAMPCAPFGGDKTGFFCLPPANSGVWIEFEHGDPEYPIWSGCWWGSVAEIPPLLIAPIPYKKLMIKTEGGNCITIDDTPGSGGIILETSGGQKLAISLTGIEISNGQNASIKLTGPMVSINSGALDVI